MERSSLIKRIKSVKDQHFEQLALDVFRYQATHNAIYRQFLDLLGIKQAQIQQIEDIPFLPIELFKQFEIKSGDWKPARVFTSSGTTASKVSKHFVRDVNLYLENARKGFEQFYGPLESFLVLALLPSYLEREGSSLILMAQDFIRHSDETNGGFFLYNQKELIEQLNWIRKQEQFSTTNVLLIGVSFALLDLAEAFAGTVLPEHTIMMETGGMKGRKKEITRQELHENLKTAFGLRTIHSEYGMTELLSQAYSKGEGIFFPMDSMRVLIREITDPFSIQKQGRSGAINIIDLANLDTVSFIATEDIGRVLPDGGFEILGRLDASDLRGCNLMLQ